MERCRSIKNSLRKIDEDFHLKNELEAQKNKNKNHFDEAKNKFCTTFGFKDDPCFYFDSLEYLFSIEEVFYAKYKEVSANCREERYLDEVTEQIEQEYRFLKIINDKYRKMEIDLLKKKTKEQGSLIALINGCQKLIIDKLSKKSQDPFEHYKLNFGEYSELKQLFFDLLEKIDFLLSVEEVFKLNLVLNTQKQSEMQIEPEPKEIKQDSMKFYHEAKTLSTTIASRTENDEIQSKTKTFPSNNKNNSSINVNDGEDKAYALLERFFGKKAVELNNDSFKKKLNSLIDFINAFKKAKENLFQYLTLESNFMRNFIQNPSISENAVAYGELLQVRNVWESYKSWKDKTEDSKKYEEYFKQPKQIARNAPSPFIYTEISQIKIKDYKSLAVGGFADIGKIIAGMNKIDN